MARAPRSSVPKTSGQGISRGIYQKGRALGGNISAGLGGGGGGGGGEKIGTTGTARDYTKQAKLFSSPPMNVSYGDTIDPTDLGDVKAAGKLPAPSKSGVNLSPGKMKQWLK
jgi:hypothetical protein